jgi:hypothetical protein
MRHKSKLTSLSCIPSEPVEGSRVTSVEADQLERGALHELAKGHRQEGNRPKKSARD